MRDYPEGVKTRLRTEAIGLGQALTAEELRVFRPPLRQPAERERCLRLISGG